MTGNRGSDRCWMTDGWHRCEMAQRRPTALALCRLYPSKGRMTIANQMPCSDVDAHPGTTWLAKGTRSFRTGLELVPSMRMMSSRLTERIRIRRE